MRKETLIVDGKPVDHYIADPGEHAVQTGAARGTVTLASGKEIDVRPDVIGVASECEAAEVAHLIGQRWDGKDHPAHDPGDLFVYDDSHWRAHVANCGNHQEG